MTFTTTEAKLIRLAIDKAAHNGETSNAAGKLFSSLKLRGIKAEQLLDGGVSEDKFFNDIIKGHKRTIETLRAELKQAEEISAAAHAADFKEKAFFLWTANKNETKAAKLELDLKQANNELLVARKAVENAYFQNRWNTFFCGAFWFAVLQGIVAFILHANGAF